MPIDCECHADYWPSVHPLLSGARAGIQQFRVILEQIPGPVPPMVIGQDEATIQEILTKRIDNALAEHGQAKIK